jgi:hypothetical protein
MTRKHWLLIGFIALAVTAATATAAVAYGDDVAQLRRATARFQRLEVADAAGYGKFLNCMANPGQGAMGQHYVNGPLLEDGQIELDRPEALLYEPGPNGQMKLVGVEYIVFVSAWDTSHAAPPTLFGRSFAITDNPALGVPPFYALHVWSWRNNPSGQFSDWNPNVSCANAPAADY